MIYLVVVLAAYKYSHRIQLLHNFVLNNLQKLEMPFSTPRCYTGYLVKNNFSLKKSWFTLKEKSVKLRDDLKKENKRNEI